MLMSLHAGQGQDTPAVFYCICCLSVPAQNERDNPVDVPGVEPIVVYGQAVIQVLNHVVPAAGDEDGLSRALNGNLASPAS